MANGSKKDAGQQGQPSFGELLKRHRVASRLTQEELAALSNISTRAIGDLETGDTKNPRKPTVQALGDALGLVGEVRNEFEEAAGHGTRPPHPNSDVRSVPVPSVQTIPKVYIIVTLLVAISIVALLTIVILITRTPTPAPNQPNQSNRPDQHNQLIAQASPLTGTGVPLEIRTVGLPGTLIPGVWTTVGNMADARYDHGLALLPDGKVLVATGRNVWEEDVRLSSSELYDPHTGVWSPTGRVNKPRIWFDNIVVLGSGKVLIAAGASIRERDQFNSVELYDPSTGTWSYAGPLNVAREQPTLTLLDGEHVLCAGGGVGPPDANRFLDLAEVYDTRTNEWLYTGRMITKRDGAQAVRLLDGRVLVGGGEGPWKVFGNTAEIYDPKTRMWSSAGERSVGWRYGSMTVLADGRVLVAGGVNGFGEGTTTYANADIYDPKTGIWSPTGAMTTPRSRHTATLLPDGRVLVVGGLGNGDVDNARTLSSCEIYDPATGTALRHIW